MTIAGDAGITYAVVATSSVCARDVRVQDVRDVFYFLFLFSNELSYDFLYIFKSVTTYNF